MSYRDLILQPGYASARDDLIEDFYIPVLQQAKRYDRIAGFFSSTSIALAARGLAGLIQNGGTMRLVTCPRLDSRDAQMMETAQDPEKVLADVLFDEMNIEDQFQQDHVAALGWMLAKGILEIKIILVYNKEGRLATDEEISDSLMHQKVGILYDDATNSLSFSGSINESASGWLENIEEFKVFSNWAPGEKKYYDDDRSKFTAFWNGTWPRTKTVSLPTAIRDHLLKIGKNFDIEKLALKEYRKRSKRLHIEPQPKKELRLFSYQEDAVKLWEDNGRQLLLEMATGCGKTRTAIGCIKSLFEKEAKPILVVIACPGNTLSVQWESDVNSLDVPVEKSIICDSTNSKWRSELRGLIAKLSARFYRKAIVYATHTTCSSYDFIDIITQCSVKVVTLLVGDEVHGMGADKAQNGLLNSYQYRLGLSATPARWFDESGTQLIADYFGGKSFVFTLHDALTTINPATGKPFLVNFYYHPMFVRLTEDELREYKKISERIIRMGKPNDEEKQEKIKFLLFQRANIEKSAYNKYALLNQILDDIGEGICNTIIFVSPEQMNTVLEILASRGICAHSFSEKESTLPSTKYGGISERQYIINCFKEGKYQVLVAIKCLDEGIDIPSAQRAIVMASSTNPREYVQRIGRIIRQDDNKPNAEIYDMILKPDLSDEFHEEFREMEKRIFEKEMVRVKDLSENALNNVQVLTEIYRIKGEI